MGFVVDPGVVNRVDRGKLTVFDYGSYAFFAKVRDFFPVMVSVGSWGDVATSEGEFESSRKSSKTIVELLGP